MIVWSKLPPNLAEQPCTVLHPWTSSCTVSTLQILQASFRGSTLFYVIHFFFNYLMKKAKRDEEKSNKEQWLEIYNTFFRNVILFGCLEAITMLSCVCIFRNLMGKFAQPFLVFIPGCLGGLAIFNIDPKTRIFYSSHFTNMIISIYMRRMEKEGILRLSLEVKTAIFMFLSTAISGLIYDIGKENAHNFKFYWFFNLWSNAVKKEDDKSETSCYHYQSCKTHIRRDFIKHFSTGLIMSVIKELFKNGAKFFNPQTFISCITNFNTFRMAFFLGLYSFFFQSTRCFLYKIEGSTTLCHNLLAGALAGSAYYINKSSTFFNFALITVVQIITRLACQKKMLPDLPYAEIIYAFGNGVALDAYFLGGDCTNLIKYILDTATSGRTRSVFRSLTKAMLT